ncbi:MAG TPA: PQQ-binding-like beta-propeller repeat protein [Kofleriaceae bacterium]
MQLRHLALLAFVALVGCTTAQIRGVVYVDRNGDGKRQKDEPGVGGVVVAVDRAVFATTDANGTYDFEAPIDEGRVWVRVPDGFRPGPAWKEWHATAGVDLPIVPLTPVQLAAPLTFVVAADSHTPKAAGDWDGGDVDDAIAQAVALPVPPRFFTILGDITAGNDDMEFDRVTAALQKVPGVPWIPVAGNHDWYDYGGAYRRHYGLDSYSFDIGRVHFVVWDTNAEIDDQIAFLAQDLAHVTGGMTVVAFAHHSPLDVVADQMEALGVDYLFTAHWHANRRLQRGKMVEWSTQPLVMGGLDQSAAGYRVVTFVDGQPVVQTRERMVAPHAELVSPHVGSCATASSVIAAVSLDAADPDVSMRVDCGPKVALVANGGWAFGAELPKLAVGTHSILLDAHSAHGRAIEKQIPFAVCATPTSASATAMTSWLQLGGTAAHESARPEPVTPPLVVRWATNVGGTVSLGTPVVAKGLALVAITDGGAGDAGGVVALDLATGVEKWRYRTSSPAVGAPAVAMDVTGFSISRPPPFDAVIVATKNGEVHGLRLSDGAPLWEYDAAAHLSTFASANWAAPVVDNGDVYIALQANFVALDAATGSVKWSTDPADPEFHWLGTLAAPAIADGRILAAFNRTLGVWSAKADSGEVQWKANDSHTLAVNATPVIANGVAYVVSAQGVVSALRLHETDEAYAPTPTKKGKATDEKTVPEPAYAWSTVLFPSATEWHYVVTTTPALAHDTLVLASQWNDLVALDVKTGRVRWRAQAAMGPLNFAHYKSAQAGWVASPVITGDLVWIGGVDGRLIAYALETGRLVWQTQLGAPITSAVAPTGDSLVVASYDGTVRLMSPGTPPKVDPVADCPPLPPPPPPAREQTTGCATAPASSLALGLLVLGLVRRRRRAQAAARVFTKESIALSTGGGIS